jgi:hypothetical protein
MFKKLRNQPYAAKWEQRGRKKEEYLTFAGNMIGKFNLKHNV